MAGQKLSEEIAEFRKEQQATNAKMLEVLDAQTKAYTAIQAELAKLAEAAHDAAVKAAARANKSGGAKEKKEMVIPDRQPDIKSWFLTYYLNNMDEINKLISEEAMSKVMSVSNKHPKAKAGGSQFNKIKAENMYGLFFASDAEFAKALTLKFEEAHPKNETQAP